MPPERRRIGYVPQEGSLFPHLTVEANVADHANLLDGVLNGAIVKTLLGDLPLDSAAAMSCPSATACLRGADRRRSLLGGQRAPRSQTRAPAGTCVSSASREYRGPSRK